MGDAGVDDNRVDGLVGAKGEAVGGDDFRLRPSVGKVGARPFGEPGIDLDRSHFAARPHELGEDGAVVAQAGADMDHAVAGLKAELVEEGRPQAGLPVVEPARLVDGHQQVMAKAPRIGVVGGPVVGTAERTQDPPWARSGEMLARNGREGFDDGGRSHVGRMPQLLGEPAPRLRDVRGLIDRHHLSLG
jgi:hypothetical protein